MWNKIIEKLDPRRFWDKIKLKRTILKPLKDNRGNIAHLPDQKKMVRNTWNSIFNMSEEKNEHFED